MPRRHPTAKAAPRSPAPAGIRARTADRVLDAAERLAQQRGFNGFSYSDIASEVGVTTASLHYHFATKEALGLALLARYGRAFAEALDAIAAQGRDAAARLARYARPYENVLEQDRMCLCGMLAAEYDTLPASMQAAVRAFFDANEDWLARQLEEGRAEGTLEFRGTARDAARHWVSSLEGAMLLARSYGEPARLGAVARQLLAAYKSARR